MPSLRSIFIAAAVLTPLVVVSTAADAQYGGRAARAGVQSRGSGSPATGGGGMVGGRGGFGGGGGGGYVGGGRGGYGGGGYAGGGYRGGYRGYYGGYGGRYRYYGPRYGSTFFIGGYYPFYDPFWSYPYYYPYGYGFGYSYYAPRTVYVEPPQDYLGPPGPPPAQDWYYCDNPQGYYPYVRTCNGEWQAVPAQPQGAPPDNRQNGPEGQGG